jgi:F-type H+-transporting ATPase subunit a
MMGRITLVRGWHILQLVIAAAVLLLAGTACSAAESEDTAGHKAEGSAGEHKEKNPLEHVMDSFEIELFESFGPPAIHLPHTTVEIAGHQITLGLSKFMVLELLAAFLIAAMYIPLAQRLKGGELPEGWRHNFREVLLTFIREEVAKPSIGHDADKYVPFLWTLFLFILFNNLLGLLPFCGSATGNIYVTVGLAICVFFAIHGSGIQKMGFTHYVTSMWPDIDVPFGLGIVLKPLIFGLEWLGVLVRNVVLAVRLFANMFAGHVVLATILIFIYIAWGLYQENPALNWGLGVSVSVLSVLAQVALSLLELFVACLQAYIFTFLASIFMGMAMHPAH